MGLFPPNVERLKEKGDVSGLVKALGYKDEAVRREAAKALGEIGDAAAVEPLITALRDEDPWARSFAASALGLIGGPAAAEPLVAALRDAVEPLVAALRDSESGVREAATASLGLIGLKIRVTFGSAPVVPLILALRDEEWFVRYGAATALGSMRDAATVQPLVTALQDEDHRVRMRAALALGQIGDAAAVEPLIAALRDSDDGARGAAAEALGKIGDAAAIEPLIAATKDEQVYVQKRAEDAVRQIERAVRGPVGVATLVAEQEPGRSVPTPVFSITSDEPYVRNLPEDPYVHWRSALFTQGRVCLFLVMFTVEGRLYEVWLDYHGPAQQQSFEALAQADEVLVSLVVAGAEQGSEAQPPARIRVSNPMREPMKAVIDALNARAPWDTHDFASEKKALRSQYSSAEALWASLETR